MKKYVYLFGENINEGNVTQTELLGGKGANLAEMSSLSIPVPPGFTIATPACNVFLKRNTSLNYEINNTQMTAIQSANNNSIIINFYEAMKIQLE